MKPIGLIFCLTLTINICAIHSCAAAEMQPLRIPDVPFNKTEPIQSGEKAATANNPVGPASNSAGDCIVGGINYTKNNAFEVAVYDEVKNVLMNPSFESGTRYWKGNGGDIGGLLCSDDAHTGKYCINFSAAPVMVEPTTIISLAANVYGNTDYVFSAWIKSTDGKRASAGIGPRGPGGPNAWAKGAALKTEASHDEWQRASFSFYTKPNVYNLQIRISGSSNLMIDDIQLEKRKTAVVPKNPSTELLNSDDKLEDEDTEKLDDIGNNSSDYEGPAIGLELLTDSPDKSAVDADKPINARLLVRAQEGDKGSIDVTITDFFGRKSPGKTFDYSIGKSGEQALALGPDTMFPKGTSIIRAAVRPAGKKPYVDFLRLTRIKYADNTAKHKTLQSNPICNALITIPDYQKQMMRNFGIGAYSYAGDHRIDRFTEEQHKDIFDKYSMVDFAGKVLWSRNFANTINGQPFKWNGVAVPQMSSYPDELLQWLEEMAYQQTQKNPWVWYWSMPTEPMGVYATLIAGNFKEYAKLVLAINRGVMKANPKAYFCPFGTWNLFEQGRNTVFSFLQAANALEPQTKFKVIEIHTYRPFPESPDVERDLTAFINGLAKIGYPDIKIKTGEGSYYYPMILPEIGLAPWTGVSEHDGYSGIVIPSYDLGWGERIGAAQITRETLVYYKYADHVITNASWCPPIIDDVTPVSWLSANSALIDILGNADFKEDVRFANDSRAYLFQDPQKRTIAAIWRFDEKFDRGQVEGTTMAMKFAEGVKPEFIDMMGNACNAPIVEGRYVIPLSGFPVFIRVAEDQGDALNTAINSCDVAGDERKLPLKFSIALQDRAAATINVINPLSRPIAVEIGIVGSTMKPIEIKPLCTETITAKLTTPVPDSSFSAIEIPIAVKYKGIEFKEGFKDTVLAIHHAKDGFSWNDIPAAKVPHLRLNIPGYELKGEDDISGSVKIAWNEKGLFMRFEVIDDIFVCPEKGTPLVNSWDYDAIQLYFDAFNNAKEKARRGVTGFDTDDFCYELLPDSAGSAVVFRKIAPDIQLTGGAMHAFEANTVETSAVCKFKYANGMRIYEVAFPARTLMPINIKEGSAFGLGFEIFDRDDAKTCPHHILSNVAEWAKGHPHSYPQVVLTK